MVPLQNSVRASLHSVTVVRLRNSPSTEPCSLFTVPIISKSVKKSAKKNALQVCLLSPHPLVLSEFERVLANPGVQNDFAGIWNRRWGRICGICRSPKRPFMWWTRMWPSPRPARCFPIFSITTPRRASSSSPKNLTRRKATRCCRWAPRDCSATREAREQLPRALPLVANGGFWVPRSVLSGFVDSVLAGSHSRRLKVDTAADLSRRETGSSEFAARESGQQRNRKQAQYFRANREISRFQSAEQVWRPPPGRSHPAVLPKAQRHPLSFCICRTAYSRFVIGNWAQRRGEPVLRGWESCYSRLVYAQ